MSAKPVKAAKAKPGKKPGAAKTGGRDKGTPNKGSLYVRAELAAAGVNLVERFLAEVAQLATPELRIAEFHWLFPFVMPRLKDIDGELIDAPPPPSPASVVVQQVAATSAALPEAPLTVEERIRLIRGQNAAKSTPPGE